jgi:integrase
MRDPATQPIRSIEALGPGVHQIGPRLYLKVIKREKGLSRHVKLRWQQDGRPASKSLGPWQAKLYSHYLDEAERVVQAKADDRDVRIALEDTGAPGSFREAAELYMTDNLPAFRSDKHRKRWRQLMESTYPVLGHLRVQQIEPAHIAQVLRADWLRTPVQILRLRAMIENVIDFALARANLNCRNVAQRGVVKHLLPRRPPRQVQHMRAVPYDEVPALYKALVSDGLLSSMALQLVLLTLCRSAEARIMTWPEVDLDKAVWTLPAGRTKMWKAHRIALNRPALAILEHAKGLELGTSYVFPGRTLIKPYSANMLQNTMKRVGFYDLGTPHGLRSTFKDWCRETQQFGWEAVELCLAHEVQGDTERLYGRSDLLHLRVPIMAAWGAFVTGEATVTENSPAADTAEKRPALRLVA